MQYLEGRGRSLRFVPQEKPISLGLAGETLEGIELAWEELIRSRPGVFDGPLVHLARFDEGEGEISMRGASGLSYRQVVGLRSRRARFSVGGVRPLALGVMIRLVSSDDQLLFRWRSSGDWDDGYEIPGGFVRAGEHPLESVERRVQEDFGLPPGELEAPELLAVYTVPEIFEAVALFRVKARLSAAEILRAARGAAVPDDELALAQFLASEPRLHPPTLTALLASRCGSGAGL